MAWKLDLHPWNMLDLTPPELEQVVHLVNQLMKDPRG